MRDHCKNWDLLKELWFLIRKKLLSIIKKSIENLTLIKNRKNLSLKLNLKSVKITKASS